MSFENIGNVKLNLTWHDDADVYSDGDVEDELLDIVKNNHKEQFNHIIREKANWPILYHLSDNRQTVLYGVDIKPTDRVLEIGAGCGAITGYLCEKAASVTSVELSYRRSLINANRNSEYDNLEIIVGNFKKVYPNITDKYDYVMLIGVLEYACAYVGGDRPFEELLEKAASCLAPGGHIIIAIENRFGLKYYAGCREDHLGTPFLGIDGYHNHTTHVQTFTKSELIKIFEGAGFSDYKFYYPYPDYKFASVVYSDECLPTKGELMDNRRNFDSNRLKLFEESLVFDTLIDEGIFPVFANSFLIDLQGKSDCVLVKRTDYRKNKYQVITKIVGDTEGDAAKADKRTVTKTPVYADGREHVEHILLSYDKLCAIFEKDKSLRVCPARKDSDSVIFDYINGRSYSAIFEGICAGGNYDEIAAFLDAYKSIIWQMKDSDDFTASSDFKYIFGEKPVPANLESGSFVNTDMILSNIIMAGETSWIIDYEWVFEFQIPLLYVFWRGIFTSVPFSILNDELKDRLYARYGISKELFADFLAMEESYAKYISGAEESFDDVIKNIDLDEVPLAAIELDKMIHKGVCLGKAGDAADIIERYKTYPRNNTITIDIPSAKYDIFEAYFAPKGSAIRIAKVEALAGDDTWQEIPYRTLADEVRDGVGYYFTYDPVIVVDNQGFNKLRLTFDIILFNGEPLIDYITNPIVNGEVADNVTADIAVANGGVAGIKDRLIGKIKKLVHVVYVKLGIIKEAVPAGKKNDIRDFYKNSMNREIIPLNEQQKKDIGNHCVINWIIPDLDVSSGGHMTIFRFVSNLENMGIHNRIYLFDSTRFDSDESFKKFLRTYYDESLTNYNVELFNSTDDLRYAHITMATGWQTAYFVNRVQNTDIKYYFVQDFEPWFGPMGTEYLLAENTYKMGFKAITAGDWLRDKLHDEYGMETYSFHFSYEHKLFKPRKKRDNVKRVFFYARPVTARRAFDLGFLALEELARRVPDVEVVFAGWDVSSYEIPFKHVNAGSVRMKDLAYIYNQCDLCLVLSTTNLSLMPLEIMASGSVVVSSRGANNEWFLNDKNSILTSYDPVEIADKMEYYLNHADELESIRKQGYEDVIDTSWRDEAAKVYKVLMNDYEGLC